LVGPYLFIGPLPFSLCPALLLLGQLPGRLQLSLPLRLPFGGPFLAHGYTGLNKAAFNGT
jgi:hypothetical protein